MYHEDSPTQYRIVVAKLSNEIGTTKLSTEMCEYRSWHREGVGGRNLRDLRRIVALQRRIRWFPASHTSALRDVQHTTYWFAYGLTSQYISSSSSRGIAAYPPSVAAYRFAVLDTL
eukprot:2927664-Rhodomonas_salina.2